MIKYISELNQADLEGKKVLLRVDFNIKVDKGQIDDFRIKSHRETISYLLKHGAQVVMISHIEDVKSFESIVDAITKSLGHDLAFVPLKDMHTSQAPLTLIDNVRQDEREKKNDPEFAGELAGGFDLYVNDAFAVSHRDHASVSAIAGLLPAYGGFLIQKETQMLSEAITVPAKGKVLIIGGAKVSTKMPVIENFGDKAEKILIGGALANDFFKARGIPVGASLFDQSTLPSSTPDNLVLPSDVVVSTDTSGSSALRTGSLEDIQVGESEQILDIGPDTIYIFSEMISRATMVIWNGPMGLSEVPAFATGTRVVAEVVAKSPHSIIGGGDTIAALHQLGLLDKISFVSTGGGAMLEFLAGDELPGLKALGYYE